MDVVAIGRSPYKRNWTFPQTKSCPNRRCREQFASQREALLHYQNEHASFALFCDICKKPIGAKNPNHFVDHYLREHPGVQIPAPFTSADLQRRQEQQQALSHRPDGDTKRKFDDTSSEFQDDEDGEDYMNLNIHQPSKRASVATKKTAQPGNNFVSITDVDGLKKLCVDLAPGFTSRCLEVDCKVIESSIVIEAKNTYENKGSSTSYKMNQFTSYTFEIRESFEKSEVTANVSTDGMLTVNIPINNESERSVTVVQTGRPRQS